MIGPLNLNQLLLGAGNRAARVNAGVPKMPDVKPLLPNRAVGTGAEIYDQELSGAERFLARFLGGRKRGDSDELSDMRRSLGQGAMQAGLSLMGAPGNRSFGQNLAGAIGQGLNTMQGSYGQMSAEAEQEAAMDGLNLPPQMQALMAAMGPQAQQQFMLGMAERAMTPAAAPEYEYKEMPDGTIGVFDGPNMVAQHGTPEATGPDYEYRPLADGRIGVFDGPNMVAAHGPQDLITDDTSDDELGMMRGDLAEAHAPLQEQATKALSVTGEILELMDEGIYTGPLEGVNRFFSRFNGENDKGRRTELVQQFLEELGIQGLANFKGAISEKELATAMANAGNVDMYEEVLRSWISRNHDNMVSAYEEHNRNVDRAFTNPSAREMYRIEYTPLDLGTAAEEDLPPWDELLQPTSPDAMMRYSGMTPGGGGAAMNPADIYRRFGGG